MLASGTSISEGENYREGLVRPKEKPLWVKEIPKGEEPPNQRSKVYVMVPTDRFVYPELTRYLMKLKKKFEDPAYPIDGMVEIVFAKPQEVAANTMANQLLKSDCDYLLKIDNDIVPDSNLLERLLSMGKDFVGAGVAIFREQLGADIAVWLYDEKKDAYYHPDLVNNPTGKCDFVGGAVQLIHRKVLEKIPHPIWQIELNSKNGMVKRGSDELLCIKARKAGFEVWYDCRVIQGQHTEIVMHTQLIDDPNEKNKHFDKFYKTGLETVYKP